MTEPGASQREVREARNSDTENLECGDGLDGRMRKREVRTLVVGSLERLTTAFALKEDVYTALRSASPTQWAPTRLDGRCRANGSRCSRIGFLKQGTGLRHLHVPQVYVLSLVTNKHACMGGWGETEPQCVHPR